MKYTGSGLIQSRLRLVFDNCKNAPYIRFPSDILDTICRWFIEPIWIIVVRVEICPVDVILNSMQLYGIGEIYKRTSDTVTEAIRLLMSNLKVHFCTLMLMCGEWAGVDLLFL